MADLPASPQATPPPGDGDPPLRATRNPQLMDSWVLVLMALGVEHAVIPREGTLYLWVSPRDRNRAERALAAQDRERQAEPPRVPPAPDQGWSAAGIGTAIVLVAFFLVAGGRDGSPHGRWFEIGAADAARIVAGQLYRTITALTLHADVMHLAGNALAAVVLVGALGRWLGGGLACALTLLSGALGNLVVAYTYRSAHISVGASTAVFGALGVLGGLQVMRWIRGPSASGGRRRALSVVAACLGVFAMLGVGAKNGTTDVLAHLYGLMAGLALGLVTGRFVPVPIPRLVGLLIGVATVVALAGAWAMAA